MSGLEVAPKAVGSSDLGEKLSVVFGACGVLGDCQQFPECLLRFLQVVVVPEVVKIG